MAFAFAIASYCHEMETLAPSQAHSLSASPAHTPARAGGARHRRSHSHPESPLQLQAIASPATDGSLTTLSHRRTPLAPLSTNLHARFSRGTELAAGCSLCSYRAVTRPLPAPAPTGCWFAAWWPGAFGGDHVDDDLGLDDDDLGL